MKRLLFALFLCCLVLSAMSQDRIVLKNGYDIKARVVAVDTGVVKYIPSGNIKGAIHAISKKDIIMIEYKNGRTEVFNELPPVYDKSGRDENIGQKKEDVAAPILIADRKYMQNNRFLRDDEVKALLHLSGNKEAYDLFSKGSLNYKISKPLLVVGSIMSGVGILMMPSSIANEGIYNHVNPELIAGAVFTLIGAGMLAGGIDLNITGKRNMRKGIESYNKGFTKTSTGEVVKLKYNVSCVHNVLCPGITVIF